MNPNMKGWKSYLLWEVRVVFLVALTTLLFTWDIQADDQPKVPSRKASVVVPLLENLSPKIVAENKVRVSLREILGDYDRVETEKQSGGSRSRDLFFRLDDGTEVDVEFLNNQLVSIYRYDKKNGNAFVWPRP
jgi:hypothetical protein